MWLELLRHDGGSDFDEKWPSRICAAKLLWLRLYPRSLSTVYHTQQSFRPTDISFFAERTEPFDREMVANLDKEISKKSPVGCVCARR